MQQNATGPIFAVQRAGERACFDHGWLQTCHSFSFAEYYDPRNVNWGALRVLNDDRVAPGAGFPEHPHRDMEILTYVLSGELEHRDSTGSHGIVGPGGAQFMSAGTGVRHSEFNHSQSEPLHFLQMWVQPGRHGVSPTYGQVEFKPQERQGAWLAVASGRSAVEAPVRLTADAAFYVCELRGEEELEYAFDADRLGFLFVAGGSVRAESEDLTEGDAVRIAALERLHVSGNGIAVLWDVPSV